MCYNAALLVCYNAAVCSGLFIGRFQIIPMYSEFILMYSNSKMF